MSDDWIDNIFANASPEDFFRETSAATVTDGFAIRHFSAFMQVYLQASRFAYEASDGEMNPTCVMESGGTTRIFTPDDDELVYEYMNRLRREANDFGAERMFICMSTEAGEIEVPASEMGNPMDDPEIVQRARDQGALQPSIAWYAEEVGERAKCGIIRIEGGHTGEIIEVEAEEASALFRGIMADRRER